MTDFGRDISCLSGLRTGRFASGPRLVAEAVFRRLTTPRGMLHGGEDEADYGLDLVDLVGSVANADDAAALPQQILAELKKDERIEDVSVEVVRAIEGPVTSFEITIEGLTSAGPFSLALGVDDVSVSLLGISADGAP